jgi:tetratricopeptide (TPR) repeat protein
MLYDRAMRKRWAGACALAAVLALGAEASAQQPPPKPKYKIQPLNLRKEALGSSGFGAVARARMRNGDCAGALEAFDAAINVSIDGSLHRDRGLCHERLGNPYPAIDDYRYYLTVEPDAADADSIRERLARLEQDTLGYSSASSGDTPPEASSTSRPAPPVTGEPSEGPAKRDAMEQVEHDHDELSSPLRAGTGWGVAPFFSEHKWWYSGTSFGEGDTWSECVGLQIRWSTSSGGTLLLEGGFEQFNSGAANISGLTSQLAYEARFRLDPRYDNQLFIAPGVGYDYFTYSPRFAGTSSGSGGAVIPRLRFGWRHMLATSAALDFSLDGGITAKALAQGTFLTDTASPTAVLIALNVGVAWGL